VLAAEASFESWGFEGDTDPDGAECIRQLFQSEPIEWNRIGAFQDVTLRLIAERGDENAPFPEIAAPFPFSAGEENAPFPEIAAPFPFSAGEENAPFPEMAAPFATLFHSSPPYRRLLSAEDLFIRGADAPLSQPSASRFSWVYEPPLC
jgi:hypothetical protein